MDRDFGGCYSQGVTIFRGSEQEGYPLSDEPWQANFIAVAAMNHPRLVEVGGELRIAPELVAGTRNKIRTILRIAVEHRQEVLVLGAWGCGAFRNPPHHMAELFREVLFEEEFCGVFRKVIFAIMEDHNSQGGGNVEPFARVFGRIDL